MKPPVTLLNTYTICTNCLKPFPVQFRQMQTQFRQTKTQTRPEPHWRNQPQCPQCRNGRSTTHDHEA